MRKTSCGKKKSCTRKMSSGKQGFVISKINYFSDSGLPKLHQVKSIKP